MHKSFDTTILQRDLDLYMINILINGEPTPIDQSQIDLRIRPIKNETLLYISQREIQ